MPDFPYQAFVSLAYRLSMTFGIGVPLVLVVWASIRKENSIIRLLTIYWKVATLLGISLLLLTDHRSVGYITFLVAPILMSLSIWFWVDLNEELEDLPFWRPLPLTVKIWRWSLSFYSLINSIIFIYSFNCLAIKGGNNCNYWLGFPNSIHSITQSLFGFLFGADWSKSLAAFLGYILLIFYIVGLLQWILIKLPKQGRIAGGF